MCSTGVCCHFLRTMFQHGEIIEICIPYLQGGSFVSLFFFGGGRTMKTMNTYDTHIENLPGSQHKRFLRLIFGREVLNGLNELSCITVAHLAGVSKCHPFGENHA